jgi:Na+-translocating ferredoxin:NAD+ oxidoreductase subunit E
MSSSTEPLQHNPWRDEGVRGPLLALCPLLVIATSTVNALGLAMASTAVLVASQICMAAIRPFGTDQTRLTAYMLVVAGCTTAVMLVIQAFAFDLYEEIAVFIPLLAGTCIALARREPATDPQSIGRALVGGLLGGCGFSVALLALGAVREIVGHGTLCAGMDALFGAAVAPLQLRFVDSGLLLAALPPGALFTAGLLIAARNAVVYRS